MLFRNLYLQSIVSQHHPVRQFAIDVGSKTHAVAAMREPCLFRTHFSGNFYSFVQGKMGIMLFFLQRLNNQIFNFTIASSEISLKSVTYAKLPMRKA